MDAIDRVLEIMPHVREAIEAGRGEQARVMITAAIRFAEHEAARAERERIVAIARELAEQSFPNDTAGAWASALSTLVSKVLEGK